jgi:hypothetical protein
VSGPVSEPAQPPLVLIKGDATAEEVAALVAVVQGLAAATSSREATTGAAPRSAWAAPARQVRTAHHAGPGGWRASALPR